MTDRLGPHCYVPTAEKLAIVDQNECHAIEHLEMLMNLKRVHRAVACDRWWCTQPEASIRLDAYGKANVVQMLSMAIIRILELEAELQALRATAAAPRSG